MIHVCYFRLKLMYRGFPVRFLSVIVTLVAAVLLAGLYQGAGDASKLKIGLHFEEPGPVTDGIIRSLKANEILSPREYSMEEGIKAVKESRIEALFVFREGMSEQIESETFKDLVDVYFLDENYLPYLLTDIVGSEMIGEIAVRTALHYFEGALEEAKRDHHLDPAYMAGLHQRGLAGIHVEKDNFHVRKTYINERDVSVDDVVLDNELLFRQVIYGVVYIFAAFYWMFLGVSIVRDRETGLGKRWYATAMATWRVFLGEGFSLWLGGLPIMLAITAVEVYYDGHALYYLMINLLYGMAYAANIFMLTNLLDKVMVYVLTVTGIIMVGGVVSGSFFALDTSAAAMKGLSLLTPSYPLLKALTDLKVLSLALPDKGYIIYMGIYTAAMLLLGAVLRRVQLLMLREWNQ